MSSVDLWFETGLKLVVPYHMVTANPIGSISYSPMIIFGVVHNLPHPPGAARPSESTRSISCSFILASIYALSRSLADLLAIKVHLVLLVPSLVSSSQPSW
ncbi:unnamed protein product [Arabis nemorensis]|uniref:Uncharacterized protein n=1 Tax=Arabis nemorensis TaxID=586526 RepID=A0A565C7W3_9BRAS|nr:unnamed protein product [Arabis nemorensis]